MIRLNHVSKIYGDGSKKAVDDLSWDIEDGKITGFIGPNGAGKTTTLKMITGILAPSEGTIEINGKDIQKDPLEAKRQFGFVPDDPDAFLRVRGIEYLNFMADIYGVGTEERQRFIEETAKRFEMEENLSSRIMSYSHGMRQKIMVMGALIHKPPVWILDEPLTGLDPRSAHELKQMMREHADAGNAVLFSTHVLEVAEKLCDRIAIIHHGRQVYLGTLEELKAAYPDQTLENIFLAITEHASFMDSHPFPSEKRTRKKQSEERKKESIFGRRTYRCLYSAWCLPPSRIGLTVSFGIFRLYLPAAVRSGNPADRIRLCHRHDGHFLLWPAAVSERVLHGL